MKKATSVFLTLLLILATTAVIATNTDYSFLSTEELLEIRNAIDAEISSRGITGDPSDIRQLEQGDEVSIIGEVHYTLNDEKRITVKVQQPNGIYILYQSHLKDEFLDEAGKLDYDMIIKLKGYFLSLDSFEEESTLRWVTLYDCEIIK